MRHKHSRQEEPIEIKLYKTRENAQHTPINQKMANNDANMGWGDADEAPNGDANDARAGAADPDGADGGGPGAGGGQQEEEVIGDGGQLKYVSYMMANSTTNAGIAEATVMQLKARGVEPGGDLDTVVLGGEQTPLVTFWGIPQQELIEKTEDVMVIGSDPRDSLMYGFEVPMNIDLKMAMKAVRKINKKTWSVYPHAPELKMTLVTNASGRRPPPKCVSLPPPTDPWLDRSLVSMGLSLSFCSPVSGMPDGWHAPERRRGPRPPAPTSIHSVCRKGRVGKGEG